MRPILAALLVAFMASGCAMFGHHSSWETTPDKVRVVGGDRYVATVRYTFWTAAAKLEAKGLCKEHKHRITKFEFRPGTYTEPGKGWAVWDPGNKMYIAGSQSGSRIMIVVNPNTGELNPGRGERDMVHEWGHALLYGAGIYGTWQEQHKIMGF